jgi:LemA protein
MAIAGLSALVFGLFTGGGGESAIQDVSETINQVGSTGEMNNTLSNVLAIFLILAVPAGLWVFIYNSLVSREEAVFSAWAQVESSYQRRSDLIPTLVDSVSRYLNYESDTLTRVTEARRGDADELNRLVQELIDAQQSSSELLGAGQDMLEDASALLALQQAQLAVGGRMTRLFALAEDYPELRSSDQFLELQGQLEGTENRINVARVRFNEAVEDYNQAIRKVPGSLIAGLSQFQRKAYFQADEGNDNAPGLDFN